MIHLRGQLVLGSILSVWLLAACKDGGTCGKVSPCGGDVTGTWSFSGACMDNAIVNMQLSQTTCTGLTANFSSLKVSGTAVFNADLTFSIEGSESFFVEETLPLACEPAGGPTTCAELQQSAADDPTVQSITCTGDAVCNCRVSVSRTGMMSVGSYSTAGTQLSSDDGGGATVIEYCVQGKQLHLIGLATTMPMGAMGTATIASDTVLTRR